MDIKFYEESNATIKEYSVYYDAADTAQSLYRYKTVAAILFIYRTIGCLLTTETPILDRNLIPDFLHFPH